MKIRLKSSSSYEKMITPYGRITHEWKEVSDDSHVYAEMEVEGRKEEPVKEFNIKPSKKGFGKKKSFF